MTCVFALLLISLLHRQLRKPGFDRSPNALLDQLGQIREVGVLYPGHDQTKPRIKMTTSEMSSEQRALFDALDLGRYLSPQGIPKTDDYPLKDHSLRIKLGKLGLARSSSKVVWDIGLKRLGWRSCCIVKRWMSF